MLLLLKLGKIELHFIVYLKLFVILEKHVTFCRDAYDMTTYHSQPAGQHL
jgi:hypothetical protein